MLLGSCRSAVGEYRRGGIQGVLGLSLFVFCAVGQMASGQPYDKLAVGTSAFWRGDYEIAIKHLRPLAEQGNAKAQYVLSQSYALLDWDDHVEEVHFWLDASAEQGYADAQYQKAYFLQNGLGVQRDEQAAAAWYEKAARSCHVRAAFELAKMHRDGRAVEQDNLLAYAWLNVAALASDIDNIINLERKEVAKSLTPYQIEMARQLAREVHDDC